MPIKMPKKMAILRAKPDAPPLPSGLDFHIETALTQARMAYRTACNEALEMQEEQIQCVIEQLEEMAAKLKAAKENT